MFPGYVLIHMVMNDDVWYVVRNTRGVTGFVGPGFQATGSAYRSRNATIWDIKKDEIVVDFEVGDTVTVMIWSMGKYNRCNQGKSILISR